VTGRTGKTKRTNLKGEKLDTYVPFVPRKTGPWHPSGAQMASVLARLGRLFQAELAEHYARLAGLKLIQFAEGSVCYSD
jgi:hypothetical protein